MLCYIHFELLLYSKKDRYQSKLYKLNIHLWNKELKTLQDFLPEENFAIKSGQYIQVAIIKTKEKHFKIRQELEFLK